MPPSNKDEFAENVKLIKEGLETPNLSVEDLRDYLKFTLDLIGSLSNISHTSLETSEKLLEMIGSVSTTLDNHLQVHSQKI